MTVIAIVIEKGVSNVPVDVYQHYYSMSFSQGQNVERMSSPYIPTRRQRARKTPNIC